MIYCFYFYSQSNFCLAYRLKFDLSCVAFAERIFVRIDIDDAKCSLPALSLMLFADAFLFYYQMLSFFLAFTQRLAAIPIRIIIELNAAHLWNPLLNYLCSIFSSSLFSSFLSCSIYSFLLICQFVLSCFLFLIIRLYFKHTIETELKYCIILKELLFLSNSFSLFFFFFLYIHLKQTKQRKLIRMEMKMLHRSGG